MKKRILCFLLVLAAAVSLLPMTALAAEGWDKGAITVAQEVYSEKDATLADEFLLHDLNTLEVGSKSLTISAGDFDTLIYGSDGEKYDLVGMHVFSGKTEKNPEKVSIYNTIGSIKIPAFPADGTEEEQNAWVDKWGYIILAYGPHEHVAGKDVWYASLTNHWQYCLICNETFNMDWHDEDTGDGICGTCENELHYYTVTVTASAGGKVEVSKDKALLNDRIDVTVTPDAGYQVKSVTFYNTNEIHSQLTRWEDGDGKYHTIVLPWDVEIEVEFEKAA